MRADRWASKKLIVAFHFQFANQAGWECDACRKAGLEERRRCGWLPRASGGRQSIVWACKGAAAGACPKSYITAESLAWVERFLVWKRLGYLGNGELNAKDAEALLILEQEWTEKRERGDG